MTRFNSKVLGISTSFPTVEGTPADDATVSTVDPGKTKTAVGWPSNWHLLSPKWRATLLAHLLRRVISSVLSGGSPKKREETITEFVKLTGWGNV